MGSDSYRSAWRTSAAAGLLALVTAPAAADVKAGVDAWSRGDYAAAVREWQPLASKGDADALFNLAQAYKLGRGVRQDLARAESLFGQAAAKGHLPAADNYGLLLFQRGERAKALPYVRAAADRGDPRAQYLLGIAHFNGDIVPKDWVRAYALETLARQAGLAQASSAIAQMDQHIPLAQRQQGVALATQIAAQVQATRARQMAAADLGSTVAAAPAAPRPPVITAAPTVPTIASADPTVGDASPATAGADYARPRAAAAPPAPVVKPAQPSATATPSPAQAPVRTGRWRVQLGAFSVAANAESLWERVKARPELAGRAKALVPAGRVTKLQAAGFASQKEARDTCQRLSAAGFACLVTSD